MNRPANAPKLHHFVPKTYLARFADSQGFLHIFDRSSGKFRRQKPKEVMKIGKYYRQDWAPLGIDPNILEVTLGEWLEPESKGALDKLIHHPSKLTDGDTANLLIYLELQRIRVPRQNEMGKALIRDLIMRLVPPEVLSSIEEGEVTLTVKDSARFDFMRHSIGTLYPWQQPSRLTFAAPSLSVKGIHSIDGPGSAASGRWSDLDHPWWGMGC